MLFLLFFSSDDDGDDERCKREWIQELKQMCRYGGLIDAHTHTQASSTVEGVQAKNWKSLLPSFQHQKLCKIMQNNTSFLVSLLKTKDKVAKQKIAFLSFPPWAFCLFCVC